MRLIHARIINILLSAVFIISGHYVYCLYLGVMHLSLEVLNRQQLYKTQQYKLYNTLFVLYELVLPLRLRTIFFGEHIEWIINFAEHLLFAIVICIKVYIYTALSITPIKLSRLQRGIIAIIIFNIVGIANEVFQNNIANRYLFEFIPDSIKDIEVNIAGAFTFGIAVYYRVWHISKNIKENHWPVQ
jgi:hypothetical protein